MCVRPTVGALRGFRAPPAPSLHRCLRQDLEQHGRAHGELAREWPAVSGDQHDRGRDTGGEDGEDDAVGRAIIAVHHGDRGQGERGLNQEGRPFHPVDGRPAQDDPLPARIQRGAERRDHLALSGQLSRILRLE